MAILIVPESSKSGSFSPDFIALNADTLPTTDSSGVLQGGRKAYISDTGQWKIWNGAAWVILVESDSDIPYVSSVTITRPANQTPYTALDVVGGALTFANIAPAAQEIEIVGVQFEADIAAIPASFTTFTLELYNVTPPSAIADNGAFDLPSGDRAAYLGNIAIAQIVDLGATLYIEGVNVGKRLTTLGTSLFAYLKTTGGYTPAANSEVYKITLHAKAL